MIDPHSYINLLTFYQQHEAGGTTAAEMNKTIACSVARAERELGYDPKIALEEGMRRSLTWCRENDMWF